MDKIRWGIIGCGDVTEVKSGPAFNKVANSSLVAVMRRNEEKARDYAQRHHVPKWYTNADDLIHDPEVNAIYIATPPSSHEEYTISAIKAGKPVYVEKPMTMNAASARRMVEAADDFGVKLTIAHYRRAQPLFQKIRQLVTSKAIGNILFVRIENYKKPVSQEYLQAEHTGWRLNPAVAGGGLFNDLSPHQLDILYYLFGDAEKVSGVAANQRCITKADDIVTGSILFKNKIVFTGVWCFNAPEDKDVCEIVGESGTIRFSFFTHLPVIVTVNGKEETLVFESLQHVQQPMIAKVVDYFSGIASNPASGEEGVIVMDWIDKFTNK